MRIRLKYPLIFFLLLTGILVYGLLWWDTWCLPEWEGVQRFFQALATCHPVFLLAGIAVLPAIGVPITPLYLLAGAIYSAKIALGVSIAGLGLNLIIAYGLSNLLRTLILAWVRKKGLRVPTISSENSVRMTVLLRVVPGIPLVAQNYLLGLSGVSFRVYFWISWPLQMLWAVGFVMFGDTFLKGHFKWTLLAFVGLFAVAVSSRLVCKRLIRKQDVPVLESAETFEAIEEEQ